MKIVMIEAMDNNSSTGWVCVNSLNPQYRLNSYIIHSIGAVLKESDDVIVIVNAYSELIDSQDFYREIKTFPMQNVVEVKTLADVPDTDWFKSLKLYAIMSGALKGEKMSLVQKDLTVEIGSDGTKDIW